MGSKHIPSFLFFFFELLMQCAYTSLSVAALIVLLPHSKSIYFTVFPGVVIPGDCVKYVNLNTIFLPF